MAANTPPYFVIIEVESAKHVQDLYRILTPEFQDEDSIGTPIPPNADTYRIWLHSQVRLVRRCARTLDEIESEYRDHALRVMCIPDHTIPIRLNDLNDTFFSISRKCTAIFRTDARRHDQKHFAKYDLVVSLAKSVLERFNQVTSRPNVTRNELLEKHTECRRMAVRCDEVTKEILHDFKKFMREVFILEEMMLQSQERFSRTASATEDWQIADADKFHAWVATLPEVAKQKQSVVSVALRLTNEPYKGTLWSDKIGV